MEPLTSCIMRWWFGEEAFPYGISRRDHPIAPRLLPTAFEQISTRVFDPRDMTWYRSTFHHLEGMVSQRRNPLSYC